jgi:hypothetical protein
MTLNGWQIPDVALGAIIAAGMSLLTAALAFVGVVLTNWQTMKRFRMELTHKASESDRNREMQLRRDVYLPAAEAIMRSASSLARLTDVRIDERDLMRELADAAGILAKTHVVAKEATVTALVRFQSALMKNFMELSTARIPLKVRQSEIDRLNLDIANEAKEAARWVELMKQFNLQCNSDQEKWQALVSQSELTQRRLHELTDQHAKLSPSYLRDIVDYGRHASAKNLETMRLLPDALLAARAEMELPIDEARYRALSEATAVEAELAVHDAMEKLSSLIKTERPI